MNFNKFSELFFKVRELQSLFTIFRLMRYLMVGLPWGQFQGISIIPMCVTNCLIFSFFNAVPIITDLRHDRLANIARILDGRQTV